MADLVVGARPVPSERGTRQGRNRLVIITLGAIIIYLLLMQVGPMLGLNINSSLANALGARSSTIAGPEGPSGPMGPLGPQGSSGLAGSDGIDGRDGRNGAPGAAGPAGAPGATGAQGAAGAPGAPGPQGPQGASMMANGAGLVGLGSCDSNVIVTMTSEFDINRRLFFVGAIQLSDVHSDCTAAGLTLDVQVYDAAGGVLAEGTFSPPAYDAGSSDRITILPNSLTAGPASSTPVAGKIVAADPSGTYSEASMLVIGIG